MINKKKNFFIFLIIIVAVIVIIFFIKIKKSSKADTISEIINPFYGTIKIVISTTGTVLPQNRLEIKPTINGRMESILVSEGHIVRKGQILAWMSSTERAALIDAARTQGMGSVKYWEDAYKAIPIVAPINGTVIVRSIEPGQSAVTTAPILVLSDRLIVKADVDETDIGRIKQGQKVIIKLDAYPDVQVNGKVNHISYESKVVNNVTMYEVNIIPDKVPEIFRSGMSADISVIEKIKEKALLLPSDAIISDNHKNYVWIVKKPNMKPEKRIVEIGIMDDQNVEIISGVNEKDYIAIIEQKNPSLDVKKGNSPFMPAGKKMH